MRTATLVHLVALSLPTSHPMIQFDFHPHQPHLLPSLNPDHWEDERLTRRSTSKRRKSPAYYNPAPHLATLPTEIFPRLPRTMLFKRFSRSRSNSQSYVDSYHSPVDSKTNSGSYDDAGRYSTGGAPVSASSEFQPYDDRRELPSSQQSNSGPQFGVPTAQETTVDNMYPRQSAETAGGGGAYSSRGLNGNSFGGSTAADGYESGGAGGRTMSSSMSKGGQTAAAPDLLLQAFNQALRPHMERVENLEAEIADLRAYVDQLEQQRSDVHAWIDKRGLRPGKPSSLSSSINYRPS